MRAAAFALAVGLAACTHTKASSSSSSRPSPAPFERQLVAALTEACPIASPADGAAREACGAKLSQLAILRDHMSEPFLWGTQAAPASYDFPDGRTTRFNPLAWRKMYLSLEMFSGDYRVEHVGRRTVLRASTRFRSALDPGEYPYPFWHSTEKWQSYQLSVETIFLLEGDTIVGALRSAAQDQSRPFTQRAFDGDWNLGQREEAESRPVVLFQRLFSPSNPWVPTLDRAFRNFEAESRPYHCAGCHRPDNRAHQDQLEMFCYPNQALASRHTIVRAIEDKRMPPDGLDDEQRARLAAAARAFEAAAEAALASEARPVTRP
jgi:hypothetical protein